TQLRDELVPALDVVAVRLLENRDLPALLAKAGLRHPHPGPGSARGEFEGDQERVRGRGRGGRVVAPPEREEPRRDRLDDSHRDGARPVRADAEGQLPDTTGFWIEGRLVGPPLTQMFGSADHLEDNVGRCVHMDLPLDADELTAGFATDSATDSADASVTDSPAVSAGA